MRVHFVTQPSFAGAVRFEFGESHREFHHIWMLNGIKQEKGNFIVTQQCKKIGIPQNWN